MGEEKWVVIRDGDYWTDKLKSEEECEQHINDCIGEGLGTREDYEYRKMTKEEHAQYN